MNNILPSGLPRFNSASVTNNINFNDQSVIIGEYAGKDLVLGSILYPNYFNTFIGYKAGQSSLNVRDSIFVGKEAGINVLTGSNNIILGHDENNILNNTINNTIALGFNTKTDTNTITIGYGQTNSGFHNIALGRFNDVFGSYNINIGNNNLMNNLNNSIFIGNDNQNTWTANNSNVIIIGNNILDDSKLYFSNLISSEPILIGNNLYGDNRFIINIGNSILKYNNYNGNKALIFGSSNLPILTGFEMTDIEAFSGHTEASIYAKNAVFTDKLILGNPTNMNMKTISLLSQSNMTSNISYVLPLLPDSSFRNVALSLNENNEMIWKQLLMNSDDVPEGNSNLYYTYERVYTEIDTYLENNLNKNLKDFVDARIDADFYDKFNTYFNINFDQKLPSLNLDYIKNGTSNQMIVNGYYPGRLIINHLVVNKIEVVGYGGDYTTTQNINNGIGDILELTNIINNTSNVLLQMINTLSLRVQNMEQRLGMF